MQYLSYLLKGRAIREFLLFKFGIQDTANSIKLWGFNHSWVITNHLKWWACIRILVFAPIFSLRYLGGLNVQDMASSTCASDLPLILQYLPPIYARTSYLMDQLHSLTWNSLQLDIKTNLLILSHVMIFFVFKVLLLLAKICDISIVSYHVCDLLNNSALWFFICFSSFCQILRYTLNAIHAQGLVW